MTITRKHNKSIPEVRESVEKIAAQLDNEFGINYEWENDHLKFSRTGISGNIAVDSEQVAVSVKKSFFVPLSDSFIRSKVEEYMDEHLGQEGGT